jgi:phytoene desaturase
LRNYLDLEVLETSYKIFYPDETTLTFYRDSDKTKQELEKFEKGSAQAYDALIEATERFYRISRPLLYSCFTKKSLFRPHLWPLLYKLQAHKSYWQVARRYFKTEALCNAFTFEAMFIGVSPFRAPAFYSIITYSDQTQKIYHPRGGMYQIPKVLESMAKKFGAQFHYDAEIKKISKNNGSLQLATATSNFAADRIVVNADLSYAQSDLLDRKTARSQYSCSVYLLYLGLKQKVEGLEHHNLFFATDVRRNLREIFQDNVVPLDPSFYIHVPTRTDASLAPAGKDIVYILVPVPNLQRFTDNFSDYEGQLREVIFERVKRAVDIQLEELIEVEHRFYPQDFVSRYNIKYGATFGLAHCLSQSAFFRPANFDSKLKNLYYVGASTQPGGGLPPVFRLSLQVRALWLI